MSELHPTRGLLEHTDAEFCRELVAVSSRLGLDPTALASVMSFETAGTFSTGRHGTASSATGLIGFMRATAVRLGTTVEALAEMTQLEQLAYVERYYSPMAGRIRSVEDTYLAVLAPSGIGRAPGSTLWERGSLPYDKNQALDRDRDGRITVGEATAGVRGLYAEAMARPAVDNGSRPDRPSTVAPGGAASLLVLVVGALMLLAWKRGRA